MKKNVKKKKIRFDRILIFLLIIFFFVFVIKFIFSLKISNIYILNNQILSDQRIIELAEIEDYPETIKNMCFQIEKKLEENIYIKDARVYKKGFTKLYIDIIENKPLFYYDSAKKTILSDGTRVDDVYAVPTVLNYITDSYYNEFITQMNNINDSVLNKISEIKFYPNDVDDNRFLLTMNDGNYVYVNISTFNKLNKYLSIMENLPNKRGILYLDYGNNFEILD